MSNAPPAELSATAIIQQVDTGAYPRELVLNFARGFLPLEQEDVLAVLAHLSASSDPDVSGTARASLAEMPSRIVMAFASTHPAAIASSRWRRPLPGSRLSSRKRNGVSPP